mgnify:CR=1 FL=1
MHGITRAYFDKTKKNNIGVYTSENDLYHIGASPINEFVTIESFLTNFNNSLKSFKFDIELWNIFVNFTKDLDKLRNENVLNYIPEFSEYF